LMVGVMDAGLERLGVTRASSAPEAPIRWPVMDLVALIGIACTVAEDELEALRFVAVPSGVEVAWAFT